MTIIFADTTVLVDIHRGREGVKEVLKKYSETVIMISEISIHELYAGLGYTRVKMGEDTYFEQKIDVDEIIRDFQNVNVSRTILEHSGLKEGELKSKGIIIKAADLIIRFECSERV